MDDKTISEMEETETETNKTKVSDSGYSNSCSNSQSQRSNSSKSRHSNSSGSSGYCGHPSSTLGSSGDENHKKKKSKIQATASTLQETNEPVATADTSFLPPHPANKVAVKKVIPTCVDPAVLDNMSSPTIDSESLQVAVLAQTLFCIKTKSNEQTFDDQDMHPPPPVNKEPKSTEMIISALKDELKHEKEFCIVVSLSDGTVVYSTASLTNVLGFPKDMWIGRSLINFLHPKDRIAFASHITSAMARSHFKQNSTTNNSTEKLDDSCYFYCWIRMYNGLRTSGFNVADKKTVYLPCQLSMNFKEVPDQGVFLVATARQVKSAYKVPGENRGNPPTFTIRHTANTLISHVDNDVVSHFGYLPHDMIGRSIFDFYYAEDLPYLKDVYTNVIMEEGLLFLSRPYKFRCQNGGCVMVETEWSSFINPWGKKLEFIIGRHRVLTGPHNPDVVSPLIEPELVVNPEDAQHNESKVFQEEIKVLLTEPIVRSYEPSKQQLAQLVESLEKISSSKIRDQSLGDPVPSAASEMLGEISPHHVYSDSKSSSETPPSYNQLTYNENIQRFFASEPKTAGSDESPDPQKEQNQSSSSGGEEGKSLPNNPSFNSNSDICLNGSGNGSGNSSGISSNSARHDRVKQDTVTKIIEQGTKNVHCKYRTRPLTEEMLYQHNENMNKQMAQKHKQEKSKGQVNRKHKNVQHKNSEDVDQDEQHGMKRSISHSWEGEPMKSFKGAHPAQAAMAAHNGRVHIRAAPNPAVWSGPSYTVQQPQNFEVQPSVVENQVYADLRNYSSPLINPLVQLPCVYMNTLPPGPPPNPGLRTQVNRATEHPGPPLGLHRVPVPVQVPAPPPIPHLPQPVQYMPSLMYQLPLVPMVYTQSHIIPPIVKPRMTYIPNVTHGTSSIPQQQPSSRDTSIKAEPGSAMCSFASASIKQGLSDSSKKVNKSRASSPDYSPGGFTSNTGKTKTGTYDYDFTHDDTSFCSYSSLFPKTEKSDDSMKSSQDKEGNNHYKVWRSTAVSDNHTTLRTLRKEPSWMENVEVTPDLMLRYQMDECVLSQVLQSDFEALLKFHQPELVNEQLDQLYIDLEGLSKQLSLEESFPSSCSSSDEKPRSTTPVPSTSSSSLAKTKKKKRFMGYDKCAMIFEEDAPMPPSASEMLTIAVHSS